MTVYVGELRQYPTRHGQWCHMMTDGNLSELHELASSIKLRREWFQDHPMHPHYDLVANKRWQAIALGAVLISDVEMVRLCSAYLE